MTSIMTLALANEASADDLSEQPTGHLQTGAIALCLDEHVAGARITFGTPFAGVPAIRLHPTTPGLTVGDVTREGFTLYSDSVRTWHGSYQAIYATGVRDDA